MPRAPTVPLTAAQRLLVENNRGLVHAITRKYKGNVPYDEFDDILQDGFVGLSRAAQLFDAARGFRFSTYAHGWICSKIGSGRQLRRGIKRYTESPRFRGLPLYLEAPGRDIEAEIDNGERVADLLRRLGRMERVIVARRFGLNGCREGTLDQIGRDLGLTRARIKQIQDRAMEKLGYTAASEAPQ